MDINNLKSCIDHDEATIRSFVRNPEYAEHLLKEVIKDGDEKEIAYFQKLYDEAKARRNKATKTRWANVAAVL